jgi:capsular polysaccharide transport system permease protein
VLDSQLRIDDQAALRPPSLGEAARAQGRSVWALILYEIRARFGGRDVGYLWTILEPVMILALLLLAFAGLRGSVRAGMEMAPFFASGILPYTSFRQAVAVGRRPPARRNGILIHAQITLLDHFWARAILAFASAYVIALIIVCVIRLAGLAPWPDRLFEFLLIMTASGILGLGVGLMVGAASTVISWLPHFMNVLFRVLFIASGIFFVPAMIPEPYREIVLLNPVVHLTEAGRVTYFPNFTDTYGSASFVVWCTLGTLFLGLLLDRVVLRRFAWR